MVPLDHVKRHVVNLRFVVKSTTLVQVRQIFPLFLPEVFFFLIPDCSKQNAYQQRNDNLNCLRYI